jgi:hypothetical protein
MTPPVFVQRMLLPLVVGLGRLLGKYRGSDWPASPETCGGATQSTMRTDAERLRAQA